MNHSVKPALFANTNKKSVAYQPTLLPY